MNYKRQPAIFADDYCDEHGIDRLDADNVFLLRSFLRWVGQDPMRQSAWDALCDYHEATPLRLAHEAFHQIAPQPCEVSDEALDGKAVA